MRNLCFLAVATILTTGCHDTRFQNPLVSPTHANRHPEFYGVYEVPTPDAIWYAHVGSAGRHFPEGFIRIVAVGHPKNESNRLNSATFYGFFADCGSGCILNIPIPKEMDSDSMTDDAVEWDPDRVEGYRLLRIEKTGDGLVVRCLDDDYIAEQINTGKLAGTATKYFENKPQSPWNIKVAAETEELIRLFNQFPSDKLFQSQSVLYKAVE